MRYESVFNRYIFDVRVSGSVIHSLTCFTY